ncbi:MAG TPA: bifunctional demethylmenaquinone methyltransferase/2-methoxy-6-polyprenyl-1,4-benzoquinol methylase UbiE [Burkholderiales bacterium]
MSDTHFGYQTVDETQKAGRVRGVFESVAVKYDVMNDLMSLGAHRLWKAFAIAQSGARPGMRVLDVAGGTGDLAHAFAGKVNAAGEAGGKMGEVWLTDINGAMLGVGRDRLTDRGCILPVAQCDAEKLPFGDDYFDIVSVAFGLRNMTRKECALAEMRRVLRPGGHLLVLEFSKVWAPLKGPYDAYSFGILPKLGKLVANDEESYRYLAESIRMHPDQETLKGMMLDAGFDRAEYFNLTAGVVALHRGFKF